MFMEEEKSIRKDCLFYSMDSSCSALTSLDCKNCKFFKTRQQFVDGQEASYAIIRQKSDEEQKRIAKYYFGKMPWRRKDEDN